MNDLILSHVARHGSHPMDLLLVRYTTFVCASYNLTLVSSGDMGSVLLQYVMDWGDWAEPSNPHCGASRASIARGLILHV